MRLDLLRTLTAVLDTGTTQGAARLLGVSQSAVSRRVSQLEEELGLLLFVRDKSRLIPTRDCAHIEGQIRNLADRAARLAVEAQALRQGNSAAMPLRIAFPASLTLSIVPAIIADFLAESPQVQVELHTGSYDTIERMLLDGRAELGFVRLPVQKPGLEVTPVMRARTVCVMPRDHPLAARAEVRIRDLEGVPLILLGRMRTPRRQIDEAFWNAGVRPQVRLEVHSVLSACGFVAAGLGVTLVNELMARDYAHLSIEVRPVQEAIEHAFAFAVATGTPPTQAATNFMELAAQQLKAIATEPEATRPLASGDV